ncbi:MAG: outer membrane protein assembly factor BamE [Gammaproteobacteria bacterium]|nr:outer membrane protein assembly factor BamE [Gammaproteobacteria bacterium]
MKKSFFKLIGIAILNATLCSCVYRIDIQQGNYLSVEEVAQIQAGMTETEVHDVLGTPMITDPYHHDRWDYLWYQRDKKHRKNFEVSRLEVHFDNGVVSRTVTEGIDVVPARMPPSNDLDDLFLTPGS